MMTNKIAILYGEMYKALVNDIYADILSIVKCDRVHVNNLNKLFDYAAAYMFPISLNIEYKQISEKVHLINSTESQKKAMNKIETCRLLEQNKISQPETLITTDFDEISEFLSDKLRILKYPNGCGGFGHAILEKQGNKIIAHNSKGVFEVKKEGHILEMGGMLYGPRFLIQEFISYNNTHKNDRVYRAYVVGDHVKFGTIRIKEVNSIKDSIININQGAHYQFLEYLDEGMRDIALRTADAIGFDIGVVDLLKDSSGNYYVIECDCDGKFSIIDRKFKSLDDFSDKYNFDKFIGKRIEEIAQGCRYRP